MYYRHPEVYTRQTVAILGGKFSATDIGLQLTNYTTKVYMCHRGPEFPSPLPVNMIQKLSCFDHMTENSVVLENGEVIAVDSIIYCTGYQYSFPFLPDGIVQIQDNKIKNLFKDIIPVEYSTIMFLSIPRLYDFFPQTSQQARYVRALLGGSAQLPEAEEIKRITDHDFNRRVVDWQTQWDYDKEIAALGKFQPLPEALKKIADCTFNNYCTNFQNVRTFTFKVTGPNSFTVTSDSD